MKLELDSVIHEIQNGSGARCLLLFGDDWRVQESAKQLINLLVPEQQGFNLERFDGRIAVWDQVQASLMTPPFIPGTKVVWIESAPYFVSREHTAELSDRVMQLWRDGKEQEASRLLVDLLALEGWTQERWESLGVAGVREVAELLGSETEEEVEKLIATCRIQEIDFIRRRRAQWQGLEELLERGVPPWGFLLMTAVQVDRRLRLYKRLDELGAVLYLGLERERGGKVSRETLLDFVNQRLRAAGKSADAQARAMIVDRSPSDLRNLSQELEKLFLYAGNRAALRGQDVETIASDYGEGWVFDLTRAVSECDPRAALSHLARLLASGQHPLQLLGVLASEVRRLLAARQLLDGELHARWKAGMSYRHFQQHVLGHGAAGPITRNAYADYMCLLHAERLSTKELCRYAAGIHDADLRLKSSGNNPRIVMERLILGMCLDEKKRRPQGRAR